jgi:hypothetical protein
MTATAQSTGSFWRGLLAGLGLGLVFVLTPVLCLGGDRLRELAMLAQPVWIQAQDLATTNLQGSILPFGAVLVFYLWQLRALSKQLQEPRPPLDAVSRRDQLLDLSASLFFGIGVIWTAVGMRDALLYSLGDPGLAAREGAFSILQRLIEGGILIALSTTIVGSVGGYLMRVARAVCVGDRLNTLYFEASQQPIERSNATLERIEALLTRGAATRGGVD